MWLLLLACTSDPTLLPTDPPEDWEVAAVHPWAQTQRTELGQVLWNLTPFHGHVFVGYGDWNDNTGPVTLMGLRPDGSWSSGYEHLTEAATVMRVIDGKLWVPPIDPRFIAPGDFAVGEPDGVDVRFSRERTLNDATHILDVASDGVDRIATGSVDLDAALWRRTDGEWEVFYTEPPVTGDFARFYGLGPVPDGLIMQRADAGGADVPTASLLRNGSVESLDFSLLPSGRSVVFRPTPFADRLVYQTDSSFGRVASELYATDGGSAESVFDGLVRAFTVDGPQLYVLSDTAEVFVTEDLQTWTSVVDAPRGCWSLAHLDGLWCGNGRSEVLHLDL